MDRLSRLLTSRWGAILTGAALGILAALLVRAGNPGNMGVCVACFSRDIAGALGFHRAAPVQYLRPEVAGLVLGALAAALLHGEFRPRTGSSPLVRFTFGVFAAIGALVFLGCPWRAYLRLGGGDWNAIPGLLGLTAGIALGVLCLRRGFSLGRASNAPRALGWVMPALALGLLALLVLAPQFGRDAAGIPTGPIFFSAKGPGSQHAPLLLALGAGLLLGYLVQRSRFCSVGAIRELILTRNGHMAMGVAALVLAAAATNALLGQFRPGMAGQPLAHTATLWNLLGMTLSGLAFTLGGGCPGRQLALSGEGDGDAAVFILGLLAGTALAHNFNLASSPAGPAPYGPAAVLIGLGVCMLLGLTLREPAAR